MGYRVRVVCAEATCCRGGDYTDGIVSGAGIRHNRFCAALQEICETWRK